MRPDRYAPGGEHRGDDLFGCRRSDGDMPGEAGSDMAIEGLGRGPDVSGGDQSACQMGPGVGRLAAAALGIDILHGDPDSIRPKSGHDRGHAAVTAFAEERVVLGQDAGSGVEEIAEHMNRLILPPGAQLGSGNELQAPGSGLLRPLNPMRVVMVGKGDQVKSPGEGALHDILRCVRAVGGGAVHVEVDAHGGRAGREWRGGEARGTGSGLGNAVRKDHDLVGLYLHDAASQVEGAPGRASGIDVQEAVAEKGEEGSMAREDSDAAIPGRRHDRLRLALEDDLGRRDDTQPDCGSHFGQTSAPISRAAATTSSIPPFM